MRINTALFSLLLTATLPATAADLETQFQHPPANCRPWVYWFWNNGNITSNGIRADLQAMQRAGVGGVLIMDVVERFAPPRGTAEFMNPEWRDLFQYSVQESARLGLEINLANGPGWCGSSGPWITPELAMQKLVWTNLTVTGPTNLQLKLATPNISDKGRPTEDAQVHYQDFYRDITLLALPEPGADGAVASGSVLNLSTRMDAQGKLSWQVPSGHWTIQRIGYTPTGATTRPPVAGGNGLECDKLSREAMDLHFDKMLKPLIDRAGSLAGKSLVATHIDSWENGIQNWTPKMRAEFQKRRGYDPLPWLPCLTTERTMVNGRPSTRHPFNVDGKLAERFRWDFQQTISELLAENYSGRLAELAHEHGLRYSIEGYNLPFGDEYTYAARADEPMSEFWTRTGPGLNETWRKAVQMASVAHVYGHPIVGAEAFTSGDFEMWKLTPADIKSLGDYEFSQGINRFVIHRYAHQPYTDRVPGATMGPWGLHYERTQTWWELSTAWHEYLARCQFLLRQGDFVADLLYLRPERPDQTYFTPNPPPPAGYRYDEISAEALCQRVTVREGELVLSGGMKYRVLVLPPATTMTPVLIQKIHALMTAGATILANGPAPLASPSLQGLKQSDQLVAKLGQEIWGRCDGTNLTKNSPGLGRLYWGEPLNDLLARMQASPDFAASVALNWIHRQAKGTEIYFVANPGDTAVATRCIFRVHGMRPERWDPQTGTTEPLLAFEEGKSGITVPLHFEASGSAFVVFRKRSDHFDPVVSFTHNSKPVLDLAPPTANVVIEEASYGVLGDAARTRDVRAKLQARSDAGETSFQVASLAEGDDPAYGVVKTLNVKYIVEGKPRTARGQDPDTLRLVANHSAPKPAAQLVETKSGRVSLLTTEPGVYQWLTHAGKSQRIELTNLPTPLQLKGPWRVGFPPFRGAPATVNLTNLISWSDSEQEGVRHFSGTATYVTTFNFPNPRKGKGDRIWLNLGEVEAMARVTLNGQNCGIAWRNPYCVEVTSAIRSGENSLQIEVANLWPNRMIGDAALPAEKRFTWSSWEPFKKETPLLRSGLLGPVTMVTAGD